MNLSIAGMLLGAGPMVRFVMFCLLAFSIVSWTIIVMKLLLFGRARRDTAGFLDMFWSSRSMSEAAARAVDFADSPEAAVFLAGYEELRKVSAAREAAGGTLSARLARMDTLKRALRKARSIELARLERTLPFLATTGSATPFIGLFGTVWGIMTSFHDIGQRGSASLAVVAPGISEALVATAAGLAVAIPATIFFNFFSGQVAAFDADMENFSADLLNLVERDQLARQGRQGDRPAQEQGGQASLSRGSAAAGSTG